MKAPDDQTYLREVQYRDGSNLSARARLHERYSTSPVTWFDFVVSLVDWSHVLDVLEVGCGTGLIWPTINAALPHSIRLTLTDLSEGMITEASARLQPLTNLDVAVAQVADVQSLPFEDQAFDVVLANHMLYHVPDVAQAAREIRRVLRPEGVLIAATNGPGHMRELDVLVPHDSGVKHSDSFGRQNGAGLLGAFFTNVVWHEHADGLRCTDVNDVVAYAISMAPDRMTEEWVQELHAAVSAVMAANDGVFTVTKDTGVFVASQ